MVLTIRKPQILRVKICILDIPDTLEKKYVFSGQLLIFVTSEGGRKLGWVTTGGVGCGGGDGLGGGAG